MEIDNMPIEELELNAELTKCLKSLYVYTIGQLAAKTQVDLEIMLKDSRVLKVIEEKLGDIAKTELSDKIEPEDQIESLGLVPRADRALKRAGISRISDLMRLSELEILLMRGANQFVKADIEQKLRVHLGDEFTVWNHILGLENKRDISIGHVVSSIETGKRLRDCGIYTVRELLKIPEQQLPRGRIRITIKQKLAALDPAFVLRRTEKKKGKYDDEPLTKILRELKEERLSEMAKRERGDRIVAQLAEKMGHIKTGNGRGKE